MPEGPEIEVMRRGLSALEKSKIEYVEVHNKIRKGFSQREAERFANQRWIGTSRVGKKLAIVALNAKIVVGAGMSGYWRIAKRGHYEPRKHDVFSIHTTKGTATFNDARKFGSAIVLEEDDTSWRNSLGSDALSKTEMLDSAAHRRWAQAFQRNAKKPIKVLMLNQSIIAGIGNIYASEICFLLGVDPRTPAGKFDRWEELARITLEVMERAVEAGGSTIAGSNKYRATDDEERGSKHLNVYGRFGEPCPICKTKIRKTVLGKRSTFYCVSCQG